MRKKPTAIEQITVRRATVADTDKVRYRVYSTPTEFIAVIAESALMAVKVSGVSKPHKIVRDLPTEGIAIEAKKMEAIKVTPEQVSLAMKQGDPQKRLMAELAPTDKTPERTNFKPMGLGEMQRPGVNRARILPPEMLNQIIEEHTKMAPVAPPEPAPAQAAPLPPAADPVAPIVEAAPPIPPEPPEPELSQEEKILKMADEAFPKEAPQPAGDQNLSPEEVEKLLNE